MSMIHLILRRLTTDPGLFVEHASAYAELAALEVREAGRAWQRRTAALLFSALVGLLAVAFSGLAAMLCAAIDWHSMPAPWTLTAVPAALWTACAALWWVGSNKARLPPFPHLRQQWAVDAQHIRDAGMAP